MTLSCISLDALLSLVVSLLTFSQNASLASRRDAAKHTTALQTALASVSVCLSVCLSVWCCRGGERERTTSKVVSNQESADSPVRTYVLQVFLLAAVAQLSRGFKREVFLPLQPVGLHVAFTLERLEGEIQSSDNT